MKAEVYRVAERYGLKVFVVANAYINVPRDPRIERVVVRDRRAELRLRPLGLASLTTELLAGDGERAA